MGRGEVCVGCGEVWDVGRCVTVGRGEVCDCGTWGGM